MDMKSKIKVLELSKSNMNVKQTFYSDPQYKKYEFNLKKVKKLCFLLLMLI